MGFASGVLGTILIILAIVMAIILVIYVALGIFLTKFNKLVYGKGAVAAWVPFVQFYLLGKLAVNKVCGWILLITCFLTGSFSITNANGDKITYSILPEPINSYFGYFWDIAILVILIIGVVKYIDLKKGNVGVVSNTPEATQPVPANPSVNNQNQVPNNTPASETSTPLQDFMNNKEN